MKTQEEIDAILGTEDDRFLLHCEEKDGVFKVFSKKNPSKVYGEGKTEGKAFKNAQVNINKILSHYNTLKHEIEEALHYV